MRRPPQLGHHARPLHENGTRCSRAQPSHRNRATPCSNTPHVRNSRNSRSTNCGRPAPSPASATARRKVLQVLGDDLVEHGVLGVSGPVDRSREGPWPPARVPAPSGTMLRV
jgi:hypothetical protein